MKGNREVTPKVALIPADQAAGAVNGPDIDTSGHDIADFYASAGLITATGTCDVKLQEADDDGTGSAGTYGDVTGGAFVQFDDANESTAQHMSVNLRGRKKWLRLVSTVATDNAIISASCALSCQKYAAADGGVGQLPAPDIEVGF